MKSATARRRKRSSVSYGNTKQAVVLVGEKTKNLYRYVWWEIETMLDMSIPVVAANLNGERKMDPDLCPPILKGTPTMQVAYKAKIVKHALDDFCDNFASFKNKNN
jgi:antiphage defense system Thoeris ThsB-like protein